MEEINIESRDRYYKELAIRLSGEGYGVEPMEDGLLPVRWLGEPLCRVTARGGAQFREAELDRDGGRAAFDHAVDIAREVRQYMDIMDAAPVLKASGLDETYKLLADFGGAVLAGHPTSHGVKFVTWEWNFDRTGVWAGHYFEDEYANAKRDFCMRAGLIDRDQLYSKDQLAEVYRSIHETLESTYPITAEREKLLQAAAEQIERTVPDLEQRVNLSNQRELELSRQDQSQTQTMY